MTEFEKARRRRTRRINKLKAYQGDMSITVNAGLENATYFNRYRPLTGKGGASIYASDLRKAIELIQRQAGVGDKCISMWGI